MDTDKNLETKDKDLNAESYIVTVRECDTVQEETIDQLNEEANAELSNGKGE